MTKTQLAELVSSGIYIYVYIYTKVGPYATENGFNLLRGLCLHRASNSETPFWALDPHIPCISIEVSAALLFSTDNQLLINI